MNDFSTLLGLAQLAIGLLGVSGIVAVFLTARPIGSLDSARFLTIVATGCLVAFLAFVPVWLNRHFATDVNIWQVASGIALVMSILVNLLVGAFAHTSFKQVAQSHSGTHLIARVGAGLLTLIIILLMFANILSWPVESNATVYEIMLFVGLVQMAISFASLVISDDHEA